MSGRSSRPHLRPLALALLAVALFAGPGWGATCASGGFGTSGSYYVASTGATTNSGTVASPWLHHPWDANKAGNEACTLLAGEKVYYRRGDTFYDVMLTVAQDGTLGNEIETTSVASFSTGTEALPILSASYNPVSLTWTNTSGTIYSTTAATETTFVVYSKAGTDTKLTVDTKDNASCATPAANHACWATGGTFYVNVGEDPATGTLLAAKRNQVVITTTGDYNKFSYLQMQMGNQAASANFFSQGANGTIMDRCTVKWGPGVQVYMWTGSNLIVSNTTTANFNSVAGYDGIVFRDTTSWLAYGNKSSYTGRDGFRFTAGADSGLAYDNEADHCLGYAYTLSNADANVLSRNRATACGTGTYGVNGTGGGAWITGTSERNIFLDSWFDGNYIGALWSSITGGAGGNVFALGVVKDSVVNDIDIQQQAAGTTDYVYNNTVLHNPGSRNGMTNTAQVGHGISSQAAGVSLWVAGNLIEVQVSAGNCNGLYYKDFTGTIRSDYNLIYASAAGARYGRVGTTDYAVWSEWIAAIQATAGITDLAGTGEPEAHSLNVNPDLDMLYRPHNPTVARGGYPTVCASIPGATDLNGRLLCTAEGAAAFGWMQIGACLPMMGAGSINGFSYMGQ